MARLGETQNPKELIPGDPAALHQDADKLTTWSEKLEGIGDDLGAVRVQGWTGKASDAFWEDFSGQKTRWYRGSDALSEAAGALRSYADMLSWAQGQATTAIDQHESGDKGAAETTLASARTRLEAEGQSAARKFKEQGGSTPEAPDWLFWAAEAAQTKTGQVSMQLTELQRQRFRNRRERIWGSGSGGQQSGGPVVAGPSVAAGAKVWGAEAKGRGQALGGEVSGKAGMTLLGAEAQAGVGLQGANASANAGAKAYLAQASAEGKYSAGVFEASGKAEGFVGAEAVAQGSIGKDGVHAGVDAFAGAKATAEGHASVAGVGVGGTAEAWAGIGAEANVDLGMENGKFVIGADLGLGLGVGAKLGGSIEVDPDKVTDAVGDAVDTVGDWGGDAVDTVGGWFD